MSSLQVVTCSRKAAEYAVKHWHYSGSMPAGRVLYYGVWERDEFIGAVIFGRGANHRLGQPYGLRQGQVCELVRVALREHEAPVSQIVAQTLRSVKRNNPGLRLVVSYADTDQGHHGGIYQAGNWIYSGVSKSQQLIIGGVPTHKKSAFQRYGTSSPQKIAALAGLPCEFAPVSVKHIYLMPLTRAVRRQVSSLALPYPGPVVAAGGTS